MSNVIYGKSYYDNYNVETGQVNYEDSPDIKGFLSGIAKRIVEDINPKTVLDAGCAMGHLVAALRDLGVEAFGIDISDYAISKVRDDVKQYCAVGSITEELPASFPSSFDLIVSIEVLEHLYEEDGRTAISNLCKYTDQFLFCSTPDDFDDPTHLNVRQREYWARYFAEEGFYDDVNYRPTYVTYYASFFRRSDDWKKQVEDYERNIRITENACKRDLGLLSKTIDEQERHIKDQQSLIDEYAHALQEAEKDLKASRQEIEKLTEIIASKENQIEEQNEELQEVEKMTEKLASKERLIEEQNEKLQKTDIELLYANSRADAIESSTTWKATKPFRLTLDVTKQTLAGIRQTAVLTCKGVNSLRKYGFKYTADKVLRRSESINLYSDWMSKPLFTESQLADQRKHTFSKDITFSILVPLYNTPDSFLLEMINSVIAQTYSKWELCLADGSDSAHSQVENTCRSYAELDNRIKYRKLEKNLGISENTNACIEMAEGDYIALFDHDDVLHPAALHEMMLAICEKDADFVYTDEAVFKSPDLSNIINIHFKPDFAPDNLRANNYICHFTAFKKSLIEKVGGFRSEFDGSQDHDLMLRLTASAQSIVHIPEVLYFWRAHPQSVAQDINAKEYAAEAGKNAVKSSISSAGMSCIVESSRAFPAIYRLKYELAGHPKISIVIPTCDHEADLRKCIESIESKSTYDNYEIVIIENNSKLQKTFDYYEELKKSNYNIKIITWEGKFNYSAINNYGVREAASGDYILLLNNDTEVITPRWMEEMLMYAQRSDVGAVGAKLYFPDETIQHAGVVLGMGGVAGHVFDHWEREELGYMGKLRYSQNVSAVTAACMMMRREIWEQVGGLDEGYAVVFNDVDLCMKIRKKGYLIVWTPYAELYHYESKSRGSEDTPEKQARADAEVALFCSKWDAEIAAGDPYYNPNLDLNYSDYRPTPQQQPQRKWLEK